MKKTQIFQFLSVCILLGFTTSYTFAYGYGNGQGQQKGKQSQQIEKQTRTDQQNFDFQADVTLTQEETERLILQYEDEYAAIGIYNHFYELYGLQVFKNIAESEQKHLGSIIALMNAYNLEIPTSLSPEFLQEVEYLKAMGEGSLKEALEAGVLFEIRDIEDIADTISLTKNEDMRKVMLNIGGGSFNHLRGFLSNLYNQGYTTDIDYSEFLSEADLQEKGLKDRFIPYLTNMGIDIDANLLQTHNSGKNTGKGNQGENMSSGVHFQKKQTLRDAHLERISEKYTSIVAKLDNQEKAIISQRILTLKNEVHTHREYSQDTKINIIAFLEAFEILLTQ